MQTPGQNDLAVAHVAEVFRLDPPERRITARTKPDARLVGDSRAQVLRDLADWIDQESDPDLSRLAEQMAAMK